MAIKAIETRYAGYRFRSRLEARWAIFLDHMRIGWEYEPEGFETSAGLYLPDFKISSECVRYEVDALGRPIDEAGHGAVYLEVKGAPLSQVDAEKLRAFACDPGFPRWVLALGNIPEPHVDGNAFFQGWGNGRPGWFTPQAGYFSSYGGGLGHLRFGMSHSGFHGPTMSKWMDRAFFYSESQECGFYDPCRCGGKQINKALTLARSARFEHGETPVRPSDPPRSSEDGASAFN